MEIVSEPPSTCHFARISLRSELLSLSSIRWSRSMVKGTLPSWFGVLAKFVKSLLRAFLRPVLLNMASLQLVIDLLCLLAEPFSQRSATPLFATTEAKAERLLQQMKEFRCSSAYSHLRCSAAKSCSLIMSWNSSISFSHSILTSSCNRQILRTWSFTVMGVSRWIKANLLIKNSVIRIIRVWGRLVA